MSYVSIWKPVSDRIVQASCDTENEIIGLLLGRLENDTILIEDSITGEFSTEPNRVTLPSTTLAKIADELVSGRTKGNIVGWYHSHTEGGLFFSDTDIQTQKKLQQFSSLITGMVVDVTTGEVGYFRVNPQTGKAVQIHKERVRIYKEPSEAIPLEIKTRPSVRPTPTITMREPLPRLKQLTGMLIISIVLIALAASTVFFGLALYRSISTAPSLIINHVPILIATVGTPIEIKVNVTGAVRNVTLLYAPAGATSFMQVPMSSRPRGEYAYLIPGGQVKGSVSYYIKAVDTSGNQVLTDTYRIQVSDFALLPKTVTLTVYRTKFVVTELSLLPINGFNQQLSLSATGAPQGLTVTFNPNPAPSGITTVEMKATADLNTSNGTFPLVVAATYSPQGAAPVTRQATVMVTVADFDLQVSPSSREISAGAATSYDLTLTIQSGFVDPVKVALLGLPQGATYQLVTSASTILGGGPGTISITLQISTTSATPSGSYNLTVSATGGDVVHTKTIQLIVR